MKAGTILSEAANLVTTDRAVVYGDMKENMDTTARLWTVYLNGRSELNGQDVAIMMAFLKVARIMGGAIKEDNYVDAAGYIAIAGQVVEPPPPVDDE